MYLLIIDKVYTHHLIPNTIKPTKKLKKNKNTKSLPVSIFLHKFRFFLLLSFVFLKNSGIFNSLLKRIFEFSNRLIGIFSHFPDMEFQNTFLVNLKKVFSKLVLKIK